MTHPIVPYDEGLIDEIAGAMDLRTPNREALDAVARKFDQANGVPFEAVCDLATAVGKTYLAGAIIDYLTNRGVRNFLIVTPGTTILRKTKHNFTAGDAKSVLGGMSVEPLVITGDNFVTGRAATAMENESVSKLYVFTVQSLTRSSDKTNKRTRKWQEWIGDDLYSALRDCDDLVVIADESHAYGESAVAFHAAVRELGAMAVIGLTATPDPGEAERIVYHYPLARAIAEKFVKTPVLVGRTDTRTDVETRLRDGLALLDAKKAAADAYAATHGKPTVRPVMFVVCRDIADADQVSAILRRPGLFEHDYDKAVLVVHSKVPDDELARLEAVEAPDSPVRVIVSVAMLKEGWDVKNIFVICSLRPSISDVLTEQTLGRGLRLPWGHYTDIEFLDTLEVLSHERYEELLRRSGSLLEGLAEQRAIAGPLVPKPGQPPVPEPVVTITDEDGQVLDPNKVAAEQAADQPSEILGEVALPASEGGGVAEVKFAPTEARLDEAIRQAAQMTQTLAPRAGVTVRIPRVEKTLVARNFTLSQVPDDEFRELGERFAQASGTMFQRKVLDVVADANEPGGLRYAPRPGADDLPATAPELPLGGALPTLRDVVLTRDYVTADKAAVGAATRLANAVIAGAGGEAKLAAHLSTIASAMIKKLDTFYRKAAPTYDQRVSDAVFGPSRLNSRAVDSNRFGPFSTRSSYEGWTKALHALNWFDSAPERTLANLLDGDADVVMWARIQRGDINITTDGGSQYNPDFYVRGADGLNYLVEVKADNKMVTGEVQTRRAAAEEWARFVTDNGDLGEWHYLLIGESVMKTARTFAAVRQQAGYSF